MRRPNARTSPFAPSTDGTEGGTREHSSVGAGMPGPGNSLGPLGQGSEPDSVRSIQPNPKPMLQQTVAAVSGSVRPAAPANRWLRHSPRRRASGQRPLFRIAPRKIAPKQRQATVRCWLAVRQSCCWQAAPAWRPRQTVGSFDSVLQWVGQFNAAPMSPLIRHPRSTPGDRGVQRSFMQITDA